MKKIPTLLTFLLLCLSNTLFSQVISVESEINGPSEDIIDLLIIGDAYPIDDIDRFNNDQLNIRNKMSETHPISVNMHRINFHIVTLVSQQRNAGMWGDTIINTALGSVFNYMNITPRLVRPLYDSVLIHIIDSLDIQVDQVLVIVNDGRRGGYGDLTGIPGTNGMKMSVVTRDTISNEMLKVTMHELGHSMFGLGDTYVDLSIPDTMASNPLYDRLNTATDSSSIEWTFALGSPGIGIYPGAIYRPDAVRSCPNCTMRQVDQPFGEWCSFIIDYRLNQDQLPPIIDPIGIEEIEPYYEKPPTLIDASTLPCSLLGQDIPNPYGESVTVARTKKPRFISEDEKLAEQKAELEYLLEDDYVIACYDAKGSEVFNLYQAKKFVMKSGKILHHLPVAGCAFSKK